MDPFEQRPLEGPQEAPARPLEQFSAGEGALASLAPAALLEEVREVMRGVRTPATLRAYRADWGRWRDWCAARGAPPLPASYEVLVVYIVELARDHTVASVRRALSAISTAHALAGHPRPAEHPQIREFIKGLRRAKGQVPRRKRPVLLEELCAIISAMEEEPHRLKKFRDRALVLLGFAGAFRRSELCAIRCEDITFIRQEMHVLLRKSKTDQEGVGRKVAVLENEGAPHLCPVRAVLQWLSVSGIKEGFVFRGLSLSGQILENGGSLTPSVVAKIVKDALRAKGVDPTKFGAHSLRAGFVTQTMRHGADVGEVMAVTGHRSADMVLRYRREYDPAKGSAASKLWGPKR